MEEPAWPVEARASHREERRSPPCRGRTLPATASASRRCPPRPRPSWDLPFASTSAVVREPVGRVPARLFALLNLLDHAETQALPLKDVAERLDVRPELLLAAIKRGRLAGHKAPVDHPPGHVWCTTVQAARQYLGEAEAWRATGLAPPQGHARPGLAPQPRPRTPRTSAAAEATHTPDQHRSRGHARPGPAPQPRPRACPSRAFAVPAEDGAGPSAREASDDLA